MVSPYRISLEATATTGRLRAELESLFHRVHPGAEAGFIGDLLSRVESLFTLGGEEFEPIDMAYHDLGHTWQTVLCLARMYEGRATTSKEPLTPGDFRRALAAMAYHDTGYLKSRGDHAGSGAKYTFVHEGRSAELARRELTKDGWSADDVESVALFILCTGPSSHPNRLPFRNGCDAELGAMVCTADFLGQMSDPEYLKKLPALYAEFVEAYDEQGIPPEARPFASFCDLWRKTPDFWSHFVLPKLMRECCAVCRYLDLADGTNPYLAAVETHVRNASASPPPVGSH